MTEPMRLRLLCAAAYFKSELRSDTYRKMQDRNERFLGVDKAARAVTSNRNEHGRYDFSLLPALPKIRQTVWISVVPSRSFGKAIPES
jgi:hypothetical protein